MTDEELMEAAEPLICQVAHRVGTRYKDFVDRRDLQQELRLWVWRRRRKVRTWLDVDPDDRSAVVGGVKQLTATLRRLADRIGRKERAAHLGYRPEDEWFISARLVKELLPIVIADNTDGYESRPEVVGRSGDPAEGNGYVALLADMSAAWRHHHSKVLEYRYGPDELTQRAIGERLGMSESQVRSREQRDIALIIEYLGGESPYGKTDVG